MSFRSRLVIGGLIVALIPVLLLGLLVRGQGDGRLSQANTQRMAERAERLTVAWASAAEALGERLETLGALLAEENEVRVALRTAQGQALQDAVTRYANSSGLGVACVLDRTGTILAASHFPGDAGRRDPVLASLADHRGLPVVTTLSLPAYDATVLARARRIAVAGIEVIVIVAEELPALGLVPAGAELALVAVAEGGAPGTERVVGDGIAIGDGTGSRLADTGAVGSFGTEAGQQGRQPIGRVLWQGWEEAGETVPVELAMAWRDPLLADLVRSYDRALLFSLAVAALLAFFLGRAMSRRLSVPVERLAATARRVHMGRLEETFGRGGARELDRLGFFLNGMLQRIREGIAQVKNAEKRATLGELARQVNHDVRNGLVPIRNVMDHLGEAHRSGPAELAGAFDARSGTLAASLDYLGELADQYRAVAVHGARERTDLREVVRSVVEANEAAPAGVRVVGEPGREPAWVEMDAVSLRRVVENLVGNGVEAVRGHGGGVVRVTVKAARDGDRDGYRLAVADDGPGIPADVRARIFEPFFTTRREGTGLGLAIARRLVRDVGGSIVLESEEGRGTCVSVHLNAGEGPDDIHGERSVTAGGESL